MPCRFVDALLTPPLFTHGKKWFSMAAVLRSAEVQPILKYWVQILYAARYLVNSGLPTIIGALIAPPVFPYEENGDLPFFSAVCACLYRWVSPLPESTFLLRYTFKMFDSPNKFVVYMNIYIELLYPVTIRKTPCLFSVSVWRRLLLFLIQGRLIVVEFCNKQVWFNHCSFLGFLRHLLYTYQIYTVLPLIEYDYTRLDWSSGS